MLKKYGAPLMFIILCSSLLPGCLLLAAGGGYYVAKKYDIKIKEKTKAPEATPEKEAS